MFLQFVLYSINNVPATCVNTSRLNNRAPTKYVKRCRNKFQMKYIRFSDLVSNVPTTCVTALR